MLRPMHSRANVLPLQIIADNEGIVSIKANCNYTVAVRKYNQFWLDRHRSDSPV
jgi:hypothetical protein